MSVLINVLLFLPAAFLAMVTYSASAAPDAAGVVRVATKKTLKVVFWTVVILVVMQVIQWLFLP